MSERVFPTLRNGRALFSCRRSHRLLEGTFSSLKVLNRLSTAKRRLDRGDIDVSHLHHRIERALGGSGIGVGDGFRQDNRRYLPGHPPLVFAPAARALLTAVADDRVPIAIRFRLVSGRHLKRKRLAEVKID